jgi:hypothetical protein
MQNTISYNQITIQSGKVERIGNKLIKFTLKNDHDYPIILYKFIHNNLDPNYSEAVYQTSLQTWVKLFKNYNFRNKVQFTPSTKIQINNIDEINLNLDELDNDFEYNSELELEEVNIKDKSEEIKKDNQNKYIFFNDA